MSDNYNPQSGVTVSDYGGERKAEQNVLNAKCVSCGAPTMFDPATQTMTCGHCGSRSIIRPEGIGAPVQKQALDFTLDKQPTWAKETRVYRCTNCGGESVFDKGAFANVCIFCGSPSVTVKEDLAGIRPMAVIPFGFDREKAEELFSKWVKKRPFAPSAFRRQHNIEEFKGYYSPSWTFDADTYSRYSGVVGDYYYVTVGSGKNRHTERRVRYRNVAGNYNNMFLDVIINSSGQTDDKRFNKLMPFMAGRAVPYSSEYLAGFLAEHYQLGLNDGWGKARGQIDSGIRRQIISSLRCDVVQTLNVKTAYENKKFKYLLLPLYIITHKYKEKVYKTHINAQNAKIVGDYPKSGLKILALIAGVLGGIVLAALIAWLVMR
ncbi:MAG: hypothetical protein FWE84_06465 [Firmicutes bacterium]|nr:hypothetical protein [Bacillota bacterium]